MTQAQFNEIDSDEDGLLTRAELDRAAKPTVGCSAPQLKGGGGLISDVMLMLFTAAGLGWASMRSRRRGIS
jgi:hypothetical protein